MYCLEIIKDKKTSSFGSYGLSILAYFHKGHSVKRATRRLLDETPGFVLRFRLEAYECIDVEGCDLIILQFIHFWGFAKQMNIQSDTVWISF